MISLHQEASHGSKYYNPLTRQLVTYRHQALAGTHDGSMRAPSRRLTWRGPRHEAFKSKPAVSSSSHLVDFYSKCSARWLLPRAISRLRPWMIAKAKHLARLILGQYCKARKRLLKV